MTLMGGTSRGYAPLRRLNSFTDRACTFPYVPSVRQVGHLPPTCQNNGLSRFFALSRTRYANRSALESVMVCGGDVVSRTTLNLADVHSIYGADGRACARRWAYRLGCPQELKAHTRRVSDRPAAIQIHNGPNRCVYVGNSTLRVSKLDHLDRRGFPAASVLLFHPNLRQQIGGDVSQDFQFINSICETNLAHGVSYGLSFTS